MRFFGGHDGGWTSLIIDKTGGGQGRAPLGKIGEIRDFSEEATKSGARAWNWSN